MIKSNLLSLMLLIASLVLPNTGWAENAQQHPDYSYFTLEPDIITNYASQGKRLGYLRLQVDLMVADPTHIALLEHHSPLIRDAIIKIIGQQSQVTVKSLAGREEIRQACLATVNELLIAETNRKVLTELLFTKYLYH